MSGDRTQPSQGGSDYWVVKVAPEDNAILGVEETTLSASPIIKALSVLKSYPNPTQEKVTVSFTLPQTQIATIKLYDNQGREMATLFQGAAKANRTYQVEWQAGNIASGMYLIRLNALGKNYVNKLFLLR